MELDLEVEVHMPVEVMVLRVLLMPNQVDLELEEVEEEVIQLEVQQDLQVVAVQELLLSPILYRTLHKLSTSLTKPSVQVL